MNNLNRKNRRNSIRKTNWDYSSKGTYFITACTKNRQHFFGEIRDGKMNLSEIGQIVHAEWLKTPLIRKDMNIELGEFIVMPNHFHCLITIKYNEYNRPSPQNLAKTKEERLTRFGPQKKNIPSIMRGFKSAVTMQTRLMKKFDFNWQPSYHDYVVKDPYAYFNIANYIRNNPKKWELDLFSKQLQSKQQLINS